MRFSICCRENIDNWKAIPNLFEMNMSIKCKLESNSPPGLLLLTIIIMIKLFISGRKMTLFDRAHRIIFWGNSMNDEA